MGDIDEAAYLMDLWHRNVCPYCARQIPAGARVGSGVRSEGGFCSLGCYAEYYKMELLARARLRGRTPPQQ